MSSRQGDTEELDGGRRRYLVVTDTSADAASIDGAADGADTESIDGAADGADTESIDGATDGADIIKAADSAARSSL